MYLKKSNLTVSNFYDIIKSKTKLLKLGYSRVAAIVIIVINLGLQQFNRKTTFFV